MFIASLWFRNTTFRDFAHVTLYGDREWLECLNAQVMLTERMKTEHGLIDKKAQVVLTGLQVAFCPIMVHSSDSND